MGGGPEDGMKGGGNDDCCGLERTRSHLHAGGGRWKQHRSGQIKKIRAAERRKKGGGVGLLLGALRDPSIQGKETTKTSTTGAKGPTNTTKKKKKRRNE